MNKFSEKDWKIFRSKIAGWQEAYMDKLNKEYIEILCGDGKSSEKFWTLEKRIKEDLKNVQDEILVYHYTPDNMPFPIRWHIHQTLQNR